MPDPQLQRRFDPMNFTLHTQDNFYTPQDLEAAAKDWPRVEVVKAFAAYRAAVDVGDHDAMAAMLTNDGRGGNATFGFFHDRASYKQFLTDCWIEIIPNHNMWQMIDGGRVVNKWCEVLPGTPPGRRTLRLLRYQRSNLRRGRPVPVDVQPSRPFRADSALQPVERRRPARDLRRHLPEPRRMSRVQDDAPEALATAVIAFVRRTPS